MVEGMSLLTGDGHTIDKWPLDPGGHCVMVCVKECESFLHLCSSGHGPLANPVALRSEGSE